MDRKVVSLNVPGERRLRKNAKTDRHVIEEYRRTVKFDMIQHSHQSAIRNIFKAGLMKYKGGAEK